MVQSFNIQFAALLAFVTAATAAPNFNVRLFERDDLPPQPPVAPSVSSIEVSLCSQISNCNLVNGVPVYGYNKQSPPSTRDFERRVLMSSDFPQNAKIGDSVIYLLPGNAFQDSGNLNYHDLVGAALDNVCPSDLGCNGTELEPVGQDALPNKGRATVDAGDRVTTMETCQLLAGGDWESPTSRLPLFQALTAGVEAMTNATDTPGSLLHCLPTTGTCMKVNGGPSIRHTLAPASMKALIYQFRNVTGWGNYGHMSYTMSCKKDEPWDCAGATKDIAKITGMLGPEGKAAAGAMQVLCGVIDLNLL